MANDPLFYVVAAAVMLVLGILAFGIGGFAKGVDPKRSNKVMQYRIAAQFVAVLLILGYVWIRRG